VTRGRGETRVGQRIGERLRTAHEVIGLDGREASRGDLFQ